MPARLIRDGLIDSERVCMLPIEARWLFVTIVLQADDVGLFDAAPFALMRKAELQRDMGPQLLTLLADADLIRMYEVGGKRFGFIPRYGQRLQMRRIKHPLPPLAIAQGDEDALSKIKHLASKSRELTVSHGDSPSEAEAEAEGRDVSLDPTDQARPRRKAGDRKARVPACPVERIVEAYHSRLPTLPRVKIMSKARQGRIRALWAWAMTTSTSAGKRRATTVDEGVVWFDAYFERASHNDFLLGTAGRSSEHAGWRCDLDFLCTEKGMRQVIEKTEVAS